MNRRSVLAAAFLPALTAAFGFPAGGQAVAAPSIDPRLAGYPTFVIRLAADRIEAPATASAGLTLLVEQQEEAGAGHAFVFRIPDDIDDADLAATLGSKTLVEETPEWFWRSEFVGNGDRAATGRPAIVVVDLQPGRYIVGSAYRPADQFARFEVDAARATPGPAADEFEADIEAELYEMGFRMPDSVPSGRRVWAVTNAGALLHEIAVMPAPVGATAAEVEAAVSADLAAEEGGDPAAARAAIDGLGAEWAGWTTNLVAGVGVLSPRRTSWAQIELEPGTYGAVCYIPDPTTGKRHLMMGMTAVFTAVEPAS